MGTPGVLVYEKSQRWEPELKRQFPNKEVSVRAVRSLAAAESLVDASPGSLLLMDLSVGAAECLRFAMRAWERAIPVRILLIGSSGTSGLEWAARELGVDHFLSTPIRGDELARLCRRQVSGQF